MNSDVRQNQQPDEVEKRIAILQEHLITIRRNHEQILSENKRLREVARLAEGELRKRREQIERLQLEHHNSESKRLEAKSRIEKTIENLDLLAAESARSQS
ncbi:MAG: hypothetical protein AUK35_05005 [Zetaproteobacteria bacterium CG2_30_46_52]|nr:MAG: hypothetical protein AUK35_05005 [Zetaproteobacteria bacterium CG2_30_46_52]